MTDITTFIKCVEASLIHSRRMSVADCELFLSCPLDFIDSYISAIQFLGCDCGGEPKKELPARHPAWGVSVSRLILLSMAAETPSPAYSSQMLDHSIAIIHSYRDPDAIRDALVAYMAILDDFQTPLNRFTAGFIKSFSIGLFQKSRSNYMKSNRAGLVTLALSKPTPAKAYFCVMAIPAAEFMPAQAVLVSSHLFRTEMWDPAIASLQDVLCTSEAKLMLLKWLGALSTNADRDAANDTLKKYGVL